MNHEKCIHSIKSWLFHRNPSHGLWLMTIPYYYCNGIKVPTCFIRVRSEAVSLFFSSGSFKGAKLLHPWNLTCPLKRRHFKRKWIIFQPAFFRGHVGFRWSIRDFPRHFCRAYRTRISSRKDLHLSTKVLRSSLQHDMTTNDKSW